MTQTWIVCTCDLPTNIQSLFRPPGTATSMRKQAGFPLFTLLSDYTYASAGL
jgi:hypothetical protein